MNSRQEGAKVILARKGAKIITEALSAVEMAAAWLVEDDEGWELFSKFMEEKIGLPFGQAERIVTDKSIYAVDMMRKVMCDNHGFDPGEPYPRKFS